MKSKKKISKNTKDFSTIIYKILSKDNEKTFNYKQLAAIIDVKDTKSRNEIIRDLKILAAEKKIIETERGKYKIAESKTYYEGFIDMTSRKTGYFVCDDLEDDVFVPFINLNKALHKDIVKAYIYNRRSNRRPEAEVIEIIKRDKTEFVGVIDIQKNFAFVTTANPKMYTDIFIPKNKLGDAQHGEVVLVAIEEWLPRADSPNGKVLKVLGKPGEHNTEMHAILAEYGLPYDFPIEVETFAKTLNLDVSMEEIKKRRDFRNILTFTIDPKDAKDLDDALSFQILDNGFYEVGVHIADVTHYLKEGTILDEEAYNRATSVYLVDRVVPMLPEVLSNDACSLNPNTDKYTFSAVFTLNQKAEIIDSWFGKTIINVNQRFAYEDAQFVIENKSNHVPAHVSFTDKDYTLNDDSFNAIISLDQLAKVLRQKRMLAGAISFDKVEVKFRLDQNNNPEGVYFKQQKDANYLIEEFMLLANRKVSEFIGKQKKTFVYRIHDEPNEDKLFNLQGVISKFGHSINLRDKKSISQSLNKLLADVKGKKEQNLVDTLTIRSMSKAKYSTDNIGHYGLAFDYYSHFTSPIRRYPDVMVHRLLQYYLDGGKSVDAETYEKYSFHCSEMESLAVNAERDSVKYMQVKYMLDHKNQTFLGVITGVTEWGIYIEIIENKCEGMVRIREIKEDYYVFDEKQYCYIGQVTKQILQLGDEVYVKVKQADLVKKQLDFNYISKKE